jgi:hypothetical protein
MSQTARAAEETRSAIHENRKDTLKKYNVLSNYTISPQNHTSSVSIIRTPN